MSNIKLKDSLKGDKKITYEKKPALYAKKCDACGRIFQMYEYANDHDLAELKGTFDIVKPSHGNMFFATSCSFKCADDLMNGKWKEIETYNDYKDAGAKLIRCELKITSFIKDEAELISEWEEKNTD